jgi:hypothetical protein
VHPLDSAGSVSSSCTNADRTEPSLPIGSAPTVCAPSVGCALPLLRGKLVGRSSPVAETLAGNSAGNLPGNHRSPRTKIMGPGWGRTA